MNRTGFFILGLLPFMLVGYVVGYAYVGFAAGFHIAYDGLKDATKKWQTGRTPV